MSQSDITMPRLSFFSFLSLAFVLSPHCHGLPSSTLDSLPTDYLGSLLSLIARRNLLVLIISVRSRLHPRGYPCTLTVSIYLTYIRLLVTHRPFCLGPLPI